MEKMNEKSNVLTWFEIPVIDTARLVVAWLVPA